MKKNFISVVIPAYNEEKVISKAIESVLSSSYKKYEIIVVNNGSTDQTKDIVEKFVKMYSKKIKLLNFDPTNSKQIARSRGPAFSRNRGAEKASGDILFFLDADDWVIGDTLLNIIESFEKNKNINFIVGARKTYEPKNWRKIFVYYWIARRRFHMKPERISYDEPYCPYIMKTKMFFMNGLFDEKAYYQEDTEFRLNLERKKIPKLISKKIVYFTDMGVCFSDFKRQCDNVAKGLYVNPIKSIGIILESLMFLMTFPIFYLMLFGGIMWRSGNIFMSVVSPFLWGMRRILEVYYLLKVAISKK